MTSKRDVQFVRLACRWRWLTAEQGEECLALERRLAGKHSVEEIIRRLGYLDDQQITSLRSAAEQHGARRRPLFNRATEDPVAPAPEACIVRSEQTVVRAIDFIPPAAPQPVRTSRRPRPAASTTPSPVGGIPNQETQIDPAVFQRASSQVIANASTLIWEASEEGGSGLGAAVPVELDVPAALPEDLLAEPVRPGSGTPRPIADDATRVEMSPFFTDTENATSGLEEPELPATARRGVLERDATRFESGQPASLEEPELPLRPGSRGGGRFDLLEEQAITDARAPVIGHVAGVPAAVTEQQDRTVVAELPPELMARLRGPSVSESSPTEALPAVRGPSISTVAPLPDRRSTSAAFETTFDRSTSTAATEMEAHTSDLLSPDFSPTLDAGPRPVSEVVRSGSGSFDTWTPLSPSSPDLPDLPKFDALVPISATPDLPAPAPVAEPVGSQLGCDAGGSARGADGFGSDGSLSARSGARTLPVEPSSEALLDQPEQAEALLGPFGPYELDRVIARGRQAITYVGRDIESGARVAVKVLARTSEENQAFISARGGVLIAVASIRSPYVVRVLDVGRVDAHHYVSLEHVDGWTLADKLAMDATPTPSRAFAWAGQVAEALAAAWSGGVAHGDVGPDRVLVDPLSRARLNGFGFSPMEAPPHDPHAPPEGRSFSRAEDAFGLGRVLQAALTGGELARGLPTDLPRSAALLVQSLLAQDPALRPTDFNALAVDLAEQAVALERNSTAQVVETRAPVRRVLLGSALTAVALVMVTIILFLGVGYLDLGAAVMSKVTLHSALIGAIGLGTANVLLSTLDLIRRGDLPLPISTHWLVQLGEGAGILGALAVLVQVVIGPPALMNVLIALLGGLLAFSAVAGVGLRRAVARGRPDRGVGRILAVLSDPWLTRWRALHGPALTTLTFLAVGRFALLAYFAST